MDMNVIICDDEREIVKELSDVVEKISSKFKLFRFDDLKGLDEWCSRAEENIDIMLLDVKIGKYSGVDFVKKNDEKLKDTCIIYMTGYDEYIEDTFETDPIYVLRKPVTEEKLRKALKKAQMRILENDRTIVVNVQKEYIKVKMKDIVYIESHAREIEIHLEDEILKTYDKLSVIEEKLGTQFLHVHKSFLVNVNKIQKYRPTQITLSNGKVIPISRTYRSACKDRIMAFLKDSGR